MNRIIKSEHQNFKILSKGNTKYDRAKIIYDRILIVHYGLNSSLKFVDIDSCCAFATGGGHCSLYWFIR